MNLRVTFFDVLVGLPGGFLIFMSTMMFSAVLQNAVGVPVSILRWLNLFILAADAFIVGLLASLMRRSRAGGSALASGIVAALILVGLRLPTPPAVPFDPLIFGVPGVLVSIIMPVLAVKLFPRS